MDSNEEWISGRRPVVELLRSGRSALRVWISPRLPPEHRPELLGLCKEGGVDCRHAPDAKLASLCGRADHGGVVAQASALRFEGLDDLLSSPPSGRQVIFALDGVENPRNLGLVARTVVAAGCGTLLLPARGGALPGPAFLEASAGYGHRTRLVRVPKLVPALEALKKDGYWVYGLDAGGSRGLLGHDLAERTVFVLGNESDGIRPTVRSALDEVLSIPLADGVDSLNVAVTAALCAFEALRAGRTSVPAGKAPTAYGSAGSPRRGR